MENLKLIDIFQKIFIDKLIQLLICQLKKKKHFMIAIGCTDFT